MKQDGDPFNTKSHGPRPTSMSSGILIHPAIWPQQIWADNWGLCPFGEGELGPHPTQGGHRAEAYTCMPSFILSHPTVSPQYTSVTDRQTVWTDRTDRTAQTDKGMIAYGDPFYKRAFKKVSACGNPSIPE